MDIVILPIAPVSIVAICIIIGTLVLAYVKKWMMTYALIISNFIVFVLSAIFQVQIISDLGFNSAYLSLKYFPQLYTLFTSMFVHGDFLHIFGNMLVFFFIGMAFEQRIGWKKFLIIYLLTGVFGALTQSIINLGSPMILIGASGAIFGIMGAFVFSYPRDEVVMPIPLGFIMIIRRIRVIYAVLLFAALETIVVFIGVQDQTAHFAHLGGFVSGMILAALIIKNRGIEKKSPFETTYYDSYKPSKPSKIDFSNLNKLAVTPEQKETLNRIEKETVSQVRDVWLEHFLDSANCPKCKNPLNHLNGRIWCEHCGFKNKY